MTIETINPTTGDIIQTYTEMTDTTVAEIIAKTHNAHLTWRAMIIKERAKSLQQLSRLLKQKTQEFAILITTEMGKPIKQSQAEIEKCALACNYYANEAENHLAPRIVKTDMKKTYVSYQPLGIIFAIMPWNFPFWQVFRAALPAIVAGNGFLLKHAPISTGTALVIEKLFLEAGILENLFRTLVITESQASKVIAHEKIAGVTLTGSVRAGKMVGASAASAIKKSVLELGGNDPYLILEDADLEKAASACVASRMNNTGQSCIAAKRLIVHENIAEHFTQLIADKLKTYKIGDPLDMHTQCGPLARKDIRDTVHHQIQESIKQGARLLLGGTIPEKPGFYYPPTLLTNVMKGMPVYDEEVFGPVVTMITAKTEEEMIHIANDTAYGLGAGVFSTDIARAEKIAVEKIQAGNCTINGCVASDPRMPFGGVKQSGYGRELSIEGLHSFVNEKAILIAG